MKHAKEVITDVYGKLNNTIQDFDKPFNYTVHTKLYTKKEHMEIIEFINSIIEESPKEIYKILSEKYSNYFVSIASAGISVIQIFDIIVKPSKY